MNKFQEFIDTQFMCLVFVSGIKSGPAISKGVMRSSRTSLMRAGGVAGAGTARNTMTQALVEENRWLMVNIPLCCNATDIGHSVRLTCVLYISRVFVHVLSMLDVFIFEVSGKSPP